MAIFVPLDVDYQDDPKIIAATFVGECIYNRALALSKRTMSDGKIHAAQLPRLCLGIPGKPQTHAALLVSVGLWRVTPEGWLISAWAKRNPSARAINDKAARKKASALKANHERWHVGEGSKPSDSCPLCYPDDIRLGSDSESTETETETETQPETESETYESDVPSGSVELALVVPVAPKAASRFDEFYAPYPRKEGKGAAERAYAKAAKEVGHDTIMVGLERMLPYLRARHAEGFCVQPARWLNEQRWNDEPRGNGRASTSTTAGARSSARARLDELAARARQDQYGDPNWSTIQAVSE